MKERLLVLAKATPEVSGKYQHLICVAGITDKGEWRRIYPIPWKIFWSSSPKNFKKKSWIEYELESEEQSDFRPESRKIKFDTLKVIREATFKEIDDLLKPRVTTIEALEAKTPKMQSLGAVSPGQILDFVPIPNPHYEEMAAKKKQTSLLGGSAVKLDIPKFKHRYIFKDDADGRVHQLLCEDWEAAELYRKCEEYLKAGKYKDENEVQEKVKAKMLGMIGSKKPIYFIVGSHFRFPTYMVIGVIYPKKTDY